MGLQNHRLLEETAQAFLATRLAVGYGRVLSAAAPGLGITARKAKLDVAVKLLDALLAPDLGPGEVR
jgi:hypothetical protein